MKHLGDVHHVEVYPRVRGGTRSASSAGSKQTGLSPRARGNQVEFHLGRVGQGSIPACAGEPIGPRARSELSRVYPRVRGGTQIAAHLCKSRNGLSPRARGNRLPPDERRGLLGSIPACAGEPAARRRIEVPGGVYPRVRGGTRYKARLRRQAGGLSPRARGNHQDRQLALARRRSIPACAGEPLTQSLHSAITTVYPRVRGGTICAMALFTWSGGLSPRARGNRVAGRADDERPGSIPACAGEPRRPPGRSHA